MEEGAQERERERGMNEKRGWTERRLSRAQSKRKRGEQKQEAAEESDEESEGPPAPEEAGAKLWRCFAALRSVSLSVSL